MLICTRFTDFIQAHVEKTDGNRKFYDKNEVKKIAYKCNLKTPNILGKFNSIYDISLDAFPGEFVLKNTFLSSKNGIYLLKKSSTPNIFSELLRKKEMTWDEIVNDLIKLKVDKSEILIEELIVGENGEGQIPFDYKLYCFDGRVEFILQIDRNTVPDSMVFFDGEFNLIDESLVESDFRIVQKGIPLVPKNNKSLIENAQLISRYSNRPFVSVDVYTNGQDVYIGELTGGPGGPYYGAAFRFTDKFDIFLGEKMINGYNSRAWPIPFISKKAPSVSLLKKK